MIVYHGSHQSGLKQLSYTEEQSRFGGDQNLKHGAGIYLTTSIKEAKAYATGGSYYKVQVSGSIFDATDEENLLKFIADIEKDFNCPDLLSLHEGMKLVIVQTLKGNASGTQFSENIKRVIDNDESLYNSFVMPYFEGDLDKVDQYFKDKFKFDAIKLNNIGSESWVIGLDFSGSNIEILEEIHFEA